MTLALKRYGKLQNRRIIINTCLQVLRSCDLAIMSERSEDPDRIENPDRSVRSVGTIMQSETLNRGLPWQPELAEGKP